MSVYTITAKFYVWSDVAGVLLFMRVSICLSVCVSMIVARCACLPERV